MTEPQIQYAKTSDGVNIAYCVQGAGPPLLLLPIMMGDIAGETALDDMMQWYERIGRTHTLIRYDPRGSGSSDRDALLDSFEAWFHDVDTIADAVPFDRFDILGQNVSSPAALVYAARRPDRVNRLILWDGYARGTDHEPRVGIVATRALIEKDWRTYTNAWAQTHFGWSNAERGQAWAKFYQRATGPENVLAHLQSVKEADLTDVLPQVRAKTLVVDHRVPRINRPGAAQFIAATLADARLVVRDGAQVPPWAERGGVEGAAALIDEFTEVAPSVASVPGGAGTAIILFADIVDSTALTEHMGDAAFREKARELDEALRQIIRRADGTPVDGKLLGDGVLSVFTSAKDAIDAALRFEEAGRSVGLGLHVGMHAGDVIQEDGNVFGGAVNIAARISGESKAGEVLVSDTVRGLARTSAGVTFDDRGEHALKGIDEPQRLYSVREAD